VLSQGEKTRKRLLLALKKLEQEGARAAAEGSKSPRLSINAVAKLAGVSHTLIHTKHPELAERIRAASRGSLLEQRQRKHAALKRARARIADLRKELGAMRAESNGLASENARLTLVIRGLEARVQVLEAGAMPLVRRR
jgi:hypothetical protein